MSAQPPGLKRSLFIRPKVAAVCRANVAQSRCGRVKRQPPTALRPPGTAFRDVQQGAQKLARCTYADCAGRRGGRRALQQDMEQFTAISTRRGIMYLLRGNMYHVHQLFITSRKMSLFVSSSGKSKSTNAPCMDHARLVYLHVSRPLRCRCCTGFSLYDSRV